MFQGKNKNCTRQCGVRYNGFTCYILEKLCGTHKNTCTVFAEIVEDMLCSGMLHWYRLCHRFIRLKTHIDHSTSHKTLRTWSSGKLMQRRKMKLPNFGGSEKALENLLRSTKSFILITYTYHMCYLLPSLCGCMQNKGRLDVRHRFIICTDSEIFSEFISHVKDLIVSEKFSRRSFSAYHSLLPRSFLCFYAPLKLLVPIDQIHMGSLARFNKLNNTNISLYAFYLVLFNTSLNYSLFSIN